MAGILLWALCGAAAAWAGPEEDAAAAYAAGDYTKAREIWTKLADKGDARAMNNLGVLFDRGQGVAESPEQAASWFQKSAAGGHGPGMNNYARMLEQGRGVPREASLAAHWFQKAAEQGNADAQYNLGLLYERGDGVTKNDRSAAAWYSMAASAQQVNAQARLGQFYRDGRGVHKNATRAVLLLYGAAMEGHAQAVQDLAAMAGPRGKNSPRAVLFGVDLAQARRDAMRAALAKAKVPAVREDNAFICDVYDVRNSVPGATEMAACYGPGPGGEQPLGFVKIDYTAGSKEQASLIKTMVVGRYGQPSAAEGPDSALWNLGAVIVATQYAAKVSQVGLMYMVPEVYHLTRNAQEQPKPQ